MNNEINSTKLIYHPERIVQWKEKGDCYPIYAEIGLTSRCNHRCVFCALDFVERKKYDEEKRCVTDVDTNTMNNTLEEIASLGVKSVMFAGEGESLLHKSICDFVETAKDSGMDVSITTNGVLFDKEKADRILKHLSWIRFSIDAGRKETHSKLHRAKESDFDKILNNIRYASKLKKENNYPVTIGTQFLLLPQNEREVTEASMLMKSVGADNIQIKKYSHHPLSKNNFVYENNFLSWLNDLSDEKFKVILRNNIEYTFEYDQCYGNPFVTLIDSTGNIIPCNLYYNNEDYSFGNLYTSTFEEIWNGDMRKEVLSKLKENGVENCRKGCRLDSINRYLNRLVNPKEHDNFV